MMSIAPLVAVVSTAVLALAACGGDTATPTADSATTESAAAVTTTTDDVVVPFTTPSTSKTRANPTTSAVPEAADPIAAIPAGDPRLLDDLNISEVAFVDQPTSIVWHPDGSGPFVAGKLGSIHLLTDSGPVEILDISDQVSTDSERGLLSLAFSPDGAYLYAHWSNRDGDNVLSAWPWSGSATIDPAGRVDLLVIEQPFPNHNGGGLAFGPDGYLYWGQGDGGAGGDPLGSGQDRSSLLGAVLRIDPNPESGTYLIPDGNPFAGDTDSAPEIWLTGLRNPWRLSFDPVTHDLWIGDVGQDRFEEIDRVTAANAGANLGWNCFEGFESFDGCEVEGHLTPVLVYGRSFGQSVTGGGVYRGSVIPELYGSYLFGDFVSGRLWALPDGGSAAVELPVRFDGVVTFAADPEGELWLASIFTGQVGRLEVG